ncbi:MAG: zinc ribbon domain-containing protein [Marinilabiliales bacterium]|nr:zinc ribbon domain-containing protein [Marinilabiliales bacterium]
MVEKERVMSGAGDLKECPNCGEKIQITAKLCRFCGEPQNEPAAD